MYHDLFKEKIDFKEKFVNGMHVVMKIPSLFGIMVRLEKFGSPL